MMGAATSFKTPSGDEMVVLSRRDYDALVKQAELSEDLEDMLAVKEFERKLAAGEEELIPSEYVYRMLDGENPVRVWREFRALSAKDLAASAGISAAYLSEIESGKKEGSLSALRKIAKALTVDLEDIIPVDRDEQSA